MDHTPALLTQPLPRPSLAIGIAWSISFCLQLTVPANARHRPVAAGFLSRRLLSPSQEPGRADFLPPRFRPARCRSTRS